MLSNKVQFGELQPKHRTLSLNVRRLQEALSVYLSDEETTGFIDALNTYNADRDVFEFVNNLKKILNSPTKRQLFPLVKRVIPRNDLDSFELLTKDSHSHTLTNGYSIPPSTIDDSADTFKLYLRPSMNPNESFGFSIRGGTEYGLGVYVSSVDPGGVGELQGLQPGDLIVEANDISFKKISHIEAAKIIKAARKLELTICRVGKIPGTHIVHQTYKWIDPKGRAVSPPPELEQLHPEISTEHRHRSSLTLLKGSDERKVNVVVPRSKNLGLMVRGGREFGLGIYISGVDPFSVAENAGIKVGDQILDVNGHSFLDVSHSRAVKILKVSHHMVITVKDVGKLPFAKTIIDKTQWIEKDHIPPQSHQVHGRSVNYPLLSREKNGFMRGAGSQLMLNSMARTQWDMIEEQSRILLNETEQATLRYYLTEYQRNSIMIDGLVFALFELLNTQAKMTLINEIRPILHPKDLDTFDHLVHKKEAEVHGVSSGFFYMPTFFGISSYFTKLNIHQMNRCSTGGLVIRSHKIRSSENLITVKRSHSNLVTVKSHTIIWSQ
ncbi:hypothetical protein LOTGIDRAFT_116246 [Lottia gigantea]|uniref:PDZ domain-containing protein n=1 Tax=Lottia gigantea TaxID=225164 RepID=V4C3E2_LOTGI|nr:hypothetical protein LOTGIDRAFT_116246 [Lottia gigantea]ESO96044.1 hypothetical protein LOTGIDRAFT_116246 [Lottia gigantea]